MSQFAQAIADVRASYNETLRVRSQIDDLTAKLADMNNRYTVMLEAQQLIATVSDENTAAVLDYITGVINKTLGELFPHDSRRIYLEKSMYQGKTAHINLKLTGSNGRTRSLTLQSGTGLRQVISFLFIVVMIEIRRGRRILIADELLSGLHPRAKRIVADIMQIFAEEGFQFCLVEYGLNDIGRIYLVEKPSSVATVTPMDGHYNDEVFMFNRPPEDVDLSYHEEVEVDEME